VALSKLLSLELRGDYHQVIALTLMQDLAKCTYLSNQRVSVAPPASHISQLIPTASLINHLALSQAAQLPTAIPHNRAQAK
jgi:hypothetical protein